ncbi:hypothetical protein GCM10022419_092030 [Nonomuraea rosea]|uniref:Uncharacterized protein n=2 Tax=Nonomuraea rosea TaxID=638574 RepID=A0ABP6Z096_9ACTN
MAGLTLLAAGLLILVLTAGPHSSAWHLLPGLIVIGLVSALHDGAAQQAAHLPAGLRTPFIEGAVAGARQFSPPVPPGGLTPADAARFARLGQEVFAAGFADAMRTVLLASAAAPGAATACCLLLTAQRKKDVPRSGRTAPIRPGTR